MWKLTFFPFPLAAPYPGRRGRLRHCQGSNRQSSKSYLRIKNKYDQIEREEKYPNSAAAPHSVCSFQQARQNLLCHSTSCILDHKKASSVDNYNLYFLKCIQGLEFYKRCQFSTFYFFCVTIN